MRENIVTILIVVLMFSVPLSIVFTVVGADYKSHKDRIIFNYAAEVTFEIFVDLYNLNPKAWYLADNAVYRYGEDGKTRYDIVFSNYKSWKKYKKWFAKRNEDKKATEKEQKREELLNLIKRDILINSDMTSKNN